VDPLALIPPVTEHDVVVHCRLSVVRFAALVGGAAGLAALTSACGQTPGTTTEAPPTQVCGTVLSSGDAGAVVFDATRHLPTITAYTVGGVLMFRVARGCDQGAQVHWVPSPAAYLVKTVKAKEGGLVAVVLRPNVPNAAFRLTAIENGKVVASARVHLLEP
jgi:hypothetical protein